MSNSAPAQDEILPVKHWLVSVLVALLCAASCELFAQHIDIPPIRSDSFALAQPQVRVSLQQVRGEADYVVGIQIDNNLQHNGSIELGDFVTFVNGRSRQLQSFNAVGREKMLISNGSIAVSGLDEYKGSLCLLLTVPAATRVVISVNGKIEFAGTPTKGAILHHGQLVAAEFLGKHQLFSRLLFPELYTPQLEVVKTREGYLWSQDALINHLISFNNPSNHPESIGGGDMETVALEIRIDTQGKVVMAKPLDGKEPFVSEAVKAISQAHFKSFALNGSAVDAVGHVTVIFFKDGRVSSTLRQ